MSEQEARTRAVYDHDNEEPRPAGRRRRQVADWGVGDEIFDHMPGRRFERRSHREIPRGDAADGRRTIVIETGDDELPATARRVPAADAEFASREEALRAREVHDQIWAGEEPFADRTDDEPLADEHDDDLQAETAEFVAVDFPATETTGGRFEAARDTSGRAEAAGDARGRVETASGARGGVETASGARGRIEAVDDADAARPDDIVRGGQAGRRTVKIGGRPAEFHGPPARARQRPPRAMHERLGPRPDRVAMWAFALGLLLILIAIATANA